MSRLLFARLPPIIRAPGAGHAGSGLYNLFNRLTYDFHAYHCSMAVILSICSSLMVSMQRFTVGVWLTCFYFVIFFVLSSSLFGKQAYALLGVLFLFSLVTYCILRGIIVF